MSKLTSHPKSPSPTDIHVGHRIRMRRLLLGMSQTTLASGLGLTFQQVQKYEKGANRVGASRLSQISEILQVPISFFFKNIAEDANRSDASATLLAGLATKDGLALVHAFRKIEDAQVRRRIVKLVEGLG